MVVVVSLYRNLFKKFFTLILHALEVPVVVEIDKIYCYIFFHLTTEEEYILQTHLANKANHF